VSSPNFGDDVNILIGIGAASTSNVWAVGYYVSPDGVRAMSIRWDGTQWSMIPVPIPASLSNTTLRKVAVLATDDVWAVGYAYNLGPGSVTFITHWDGTAWSVIPSPNPGVDRNELWGISAIAPDDIWAVGLFETDQSGSGADSLALHWNGTEWSQGPTPQFDNDEVLFDVSAISSDDVWAVGYYHPDTDRALILYWDGTGWTSVSGPDVGNNYLYGVKALTSDDVWAAGYAMGAETLALHWDGTQWSRIPSPNPGAITSNLEAVAAFSTDDVWAVGHFWGGNGTPFKTLIERYYDACSTPSPTTTGTPLTATPTFTRTPTRTRTATVTGTLTYTSTPTPIISPTATATSSVCAISFTDVPQGSTFYPYIHCLACLGIVNGYGDGTFHPGDNVSRGQLSKIVSNSAGFQEPPGSQMFEDVLPGSTFYDFIWRLASRGYINGYPCGGAGEPCGPDSLPYFRPSSNATRGQISKIVSNSAGFNDPPGAQLFEDVPPGSTFYDYIQRLANRGVISGYPCGGAGEPCGPANLPYFRPSDNATRGQTSKIDANTFFPSCPEQ
jgi:hypothetical protein